MAELKLDKQTQYRCTIQGIIKLYDDLRFWITKDHTDLMLRTPFKHLFEAIIDGKIDGSRKKDQILDDLLRSFDQKEGKFRFGSQYCMPSRMDVKLILGIEDGPDDVGKDKKHRWDATEFGPRIFGKINKISASLIKGRIHESVMSKDEKDIQDTVKLMCLLLFTCFLFPNTGSCIAWRYVYYVDNFERLSSYDWSSHVLNKLKEGLNNDWTDPTKVNGCTLFLLYWFAEHSTRMRLMFTVYQDGYTGSSWIPRLSKWKLTQLESVINKAYLTELGEDMFDCAELTPTGAEKIILKSLNGNINQEENLVVEDSDFEDSVVVKKRVGGAIRGKATKWARKIARGNNSGKHMFDNSSMICNLTTKDTSKNSRKVHVEDLGGPSFSLFQNESQDILNDNHDAENTELVKNNQTYEESDTGNGDWKNNQQVHTMEGGLIKHDVAGCVEVDQVNDRTVIVFGGGSSMAEQADRVRILEQSVEKLKEENQTQALLIKSLETERNNADNVVTSQVAKNVTYLHEISGLRAENNILTKALDAATEKLGENLVNKKTLDNYSARMQDAMDNLKNQVEVKRNEHVELINSLKDKNHVIRNYEAKVLKLEEELFNIRKQLEVMITIRNEDAKTINVMRKTIEEREKQVVDSLQRVKELEKVIENNEDVMISNEVHQVTQLYAQSALPDEGQVGPSVRNEQKIVEPSSMVGRVKDRKVRKRVKYEKYEYPLDKNLEEAYVDQSKNDTYIAPKNSNCERRIVFMEKKGKENKLQHFR